MNTCFTGVYSDAIHSDGYIFMFFWKLNIEIKVKHRIRKRLKWIILKLIGLRTVILSVKRARLKHMCKKKKKIRLA